jgi:hypothetical protein
MGHRCCSARPFNRGQLGQESSILLEHGFEIPFRHRPMYLKLFGGR